MNFSSARRFRVILIGSSGDDFVRYAKGLLEQYGVEFVRCDDVYLAVGELAGSTDASILAIGRLEQLSREQGRFFQIAIDKGICCCCLVDGGLAGMKKQLRLGLTANETAIFIINEPDEIKGVITKLLAEGLTSLLPKHGNRLSEIIKDDFLTTKAELDALLGT